jgi:redox-sensitive bicupin YhaK (pirin superfamily)
MITTIPSEARHFGDFGWLATHWHFSFGDYHDPANMNWGALRVFNDDVIQGSGGFEPHPHRDMEIVTVVLEGALEHEDSTGNKGLIKPWEVQVMSAGKGIIHSERNASKDDPLHLLQLWIMPRHRGNKPRWEQKPFDPALAHGKLLPVVSSGDVPGTLAIDQDATVYLSQLRAGEEVAHVSNAQRKLYLFAIAGRVSANGIELSPGDQARIADESKLEIKAREDAQLILLDLPDLK